MLWGVQYTLPFIRSRIAILTILKYLLFQLHALSSCLKAYTTAKTMAGIEQCRLACGGHGYSLASGIPKIYATCTPACTYEGENTVLLLQTARYVVVCTARVHHDL